MVGGGGGGVVLAGQITVVDVMVSVVTCPVGQFGMTGGHEVTVYTVVV